MSVVASATPDPRYAPIVEALRPLGYGTDHIRYDMRYGDFEALKSLSQDRTPGTLPSAQNKMGRLDLVAFHDAHEHDWNTTAIVAEFDKPQLLDNKNEGRKRAKWLFGNTAAPHVVLVGGGLADLWLKCWDSPELVADIPVETASLLKTFQGHRRDLQREELASLRGGQRYLFDRIFDVHREELANFLNLGISKATWLSSEVESGADELLGQSLSRTAIALLAARILEDKGFFGELREPSTDAFQLLADADSRANGFFSHVITGDVGYLRGKLGDAKVAEMLRCVMAYLTGPACFSMVTPGMLGDLYEKALIAERRKGQGELELKGVHYTPLSLAKNVLDRIPIEELPVQQRFVMDFACGSGAFLLAATERLKGAFDANEPGADPSLLAHLQGHVIGNDKDAISLLVPKLAYFLTHFLETGGVGEPPVPNRMLSRDALTLSASDFAGDRPTVIVGNPPFYKAAGGVQVANRFLHKAIELLADGGYLGMIMPGGFLRTEDEGCPDARRELLRTCRLMEVWEMPSRAVGLAADQDTCLLIARKRTRPARVEPVLFKVTYSRAKEAIEALQNHARATWTFMTSRRAGRPEGVGLDDPAYRILASPAEPALRKIGVARPLSSAFEGAWGLNVDRNTEFSQGEREGYRPYLRSQARLRPFFLAREDWHYNPPGWGNYVNPRSARRTGERSWSLYERPKVMLTGRVNRNSTDQLRAAFDAGGVFPEHDLFCVGLRRSSLPAWAEELLASEGEARVLLWLTAILNSTLAKVWVATHSSARGFSRRTIDTMPLPERYDRSLPDLVERTRGLRDDPIGYRSIADEIDAGVIRSYGLSASEAALLSRGRKGATDPWVQGGEIAHLPGPGRRRTISGTVISTDVPRQTITVDLPSFDRCQPGPHVLPLPLHIPGWALRDGAEFTCSIPDACEDVAALKSDQWLLRDFMPLPYGYLDVEDLEALVGYRDTATPA